MENSRLREGDAYSFLVAAIKASDESAVSLGRKLFDLGDGTQSVNASSLLMQAASASHDEVASLVNAVATPLADSVALAWKRLETISIALPGWTIGEPAIAENRSLWLRDLIRELARFELPPQRNDALLWLAIHSGTFAEKEDSEFAALMAELLGGSLYRLGTTGCDHVGRLLACEISLNQTVSDDLFDTLRLVGTGRHPALPAENRYVPSPHVARGLAGCGHEDAIEALCETITLERGNPELVVTAAVQAVSAAAEVFEVFPDILPSVLETIATQIGKGPVDRETLAKQLASVLALPAPILADSASDAVLRTFAAALRNEEHRQQMMSSNDDSELFLACWAEAAIDIHACVTRLLERYEKACMDGREDIKLLLRTFARIREGATLAMRPMWLRILQESLGDSPEQLNVVLLAEAFQFGKASGLTLENKEVIPTDDALDMLIEIEKRLRNKKMMADLVKVSSLKTADDNTSTLVRLIVLNLAGRPGDTLLPFVERLDNQSMAFIADADLSVTDPKTRAAIFERSNLSYPHGPKLMVRAVAAAESIEELSEWLHGQARAHRSIDALFAIACALRKDRMKLWRELLLASKKDNRQLGLQVVVTTLKVIDRLKRFNESKVMSALPSTFVVDDDAIRHDSSQVLDEYEAQQTKKKNGDDLKSHLFLTARELSQSSDELETEVRKRRVALERLCDRVAEMTGIDRNRFVPTPPQPPRDRGSRYTDLFGDVAPKLIETAVSVWEDLVKRSLDFDQWKAEFHQWFDNRGQDLRESNGSERLRAHWWFVGPGNWQYFDEKVLSRAEPLMSAGQIQRMSELRRPSLKVSKGRAFEEMFSSLKWETPYDRGDEVLIELDWYESVLANLPESIQKLGPLGEYSAVPHPPHEQAIAYVYMGLDDWLRSKQVDASLKERIRQRLWPLLWWTASFGGRVDRIDAAAIGSAVSSGQATLGDLVWYLVQPGYAQTADNLVQAVEYPDRIFLGIDADRDAEIRTVIDAVAVVCREQEQAIDPSLPPILGTTWPKMPAPQDQSGLREILTKYADVAYQTVGRTSDQQKAFADRIRECLRAAKKNWIVAEDYFSPHYVKFDILDAWIKRTVVELQRLFKERIVSEDSLLRIALDQPLLTRCVLEAMQRRDQLEAAIWILFHAAAGLEELAITLGGDTGHAALRRSELNTKQIEQRLLDHYSPEIGKRSNDWFYKPIEDATIRVGWKKRAIDIHPRENLEPMFKALKAVMSPTDHLRGEGLLDAMDGKLSSPEKRKALEASIKDRPNLALLQLAVMPLPDGHEKVVAEISRRLKIFEDMSIAGRKRKSAEARESMRRALNQVRRSLADNAGLADPTQLEWLSGEAIAKELAEFERLETGDYIIQLRLRADGPHVLVSKSGKALKSIPAAFKSTEKGKHLTELQNRLKTSLRDTRAVFEESMVEQRGYSHDDLKMIMKHPVVASVASELVFVVNPGTETEHAVVGLPSESGGELVGLDGKRQQVLHAVRVAHPLELDELGVLSAWQEGFTDHPPQPFQQVERAIIRVNDLETVNEGKSVIRHDGVELKNQDQAFRILQAHGWSDNREIHELCRTFRSDTADEITAILPEFMAHSGTVGPLTFRDANWNEVGVDTVCPVVLSEAVRDVDRTVAAAS